MSRSPALLVDLDGTLLDTTPMILASYRAAFRAAGLAAPAEDVLRRSMGLPVPDTLRRLLPGGAAPLLRELEARYRAHLAAVHDREVRAFPGARKLLETARRCGLPVAVVTTKGEELARRGLALAGLLPWVGTLVGRESSPAPKPSPAPVLVALERLGARREGSWLVGDAPVDMGAARAAGVRAVGVCHGLFSPGELEQAGAQLLCASLHEVAHRLQAEAGERGEHRCGCSSSTGPI